MGTSEELRRITMTPAARRALAAAGRLFYDRGIHAVGVDLIAAEAGVTKKTLYDRFGSKEQIVVEYLADRDERWRAFLAERLDAAQPAPRARVRAVFDASRAWMSDNGSKGCSMVNAHAEISDPAHPAHAVITGQKQWMLDLFTRLARDVEGLGPGAADRLGRTLMLLHEGALVAHGLKVFPDPVAHARDEAEALLAEVTER
ncbi:MULTISPECIES: TetR/AcrR family transcriptional regulator [Streptomyces]|uniref:TetR/AcrR family transcriptional regulator n=1 Tax=Streptomyces TaxID=1883 RepID=UPI00093D1126|nr:MULTISPECIES: TetR/AcrR family transcriptional regulator [unclassified Streptomyces]OKJ03419.1 TetR family transcriptional regulator [Streptomyces sp. TSRI0261]QNQ37533.1 helix-turn-helix transcriptional regulator [Streptomyces sp. CB00271]